MDDARQMLKWIDPKLGKPLPEKSYGGTCRIYDWETPEDPWHNLMDKMDGFVLVHFFGWWFKVWRTKGDPSVIMVFLLRDFLATRYH